MRLNNSNEIKIIPPIYIVLVAVFLTNFFVNLELMGRDEPINFSHFLPNIVSFVLFLLVHRVGVSFNFDGEGETLIFKNNGVFFSKFMEYRLKKAEFPKRKLANYNFTDYGVYSSITIYIKSRRRKGFKKYTFNTTFLSRKKKRELVESLKNVLDKPKAVA
ncbi:hypothetical protein [Zunongwangia sp. HRR-M8]|uniref:hypothetical protein n=1 Tax=Zunongwangia sp. HRR-M8 TaxID=3015170 RepID=UPI0022DE61D3|nr:hypothetical protein [Zunongwangia sp. HRR-M8]WBL20807.1 hypothetical protein PBT89_08680 [Zunongwangia sp. HRR-M8]